MTAIETSQIIRANKESDSLRTTIPPPILNYLKLNKGDVIKWERKIIKNSNNGKICNCVMIQKVEKADVKSGICPDCGENNWRKNDIDKKVICVECGYVKGDL